MLGIQASPASAMTIFTPGWRSKTPAKISPVMGSEQLNARRLFGKARSDRDRRIGAAGIAGIETRLFDQDSEMKPDRDSDFFRERPEGLPSIIVHRRVRARG